MSDIDTSRISPTAHYTGFVWVKNGLSPKGLATVGGRALYTAGVGPMALASLGIGGLTLEKLLLQRHLIIDHQLSRAIEAGEIGQVLELAGGLTGRGHRFTRRYPDLTYVEGDLPDMAATKRRLLRSLSDQAASPRHHVVGLNVLADSGPLQIGEATASLLEPTRGTALITEGLLNYFPRQEVAAMWSRFGQLLDRFPGWLYLGDIHLAEGSEEWLLVRAFRQLLSVIARGQSYLHFKSEHELGAELNRAGLAGRFTLLRPRRLAGQIDLPLGWGPDLVSVLETKS